MNSNTNNNLETNPTLQAYDAMAETYSEYSDSRKKYLEQIENLVIEKLKPQFRVLDVGAGDGRRLKKIMDRVGLSDIVAIEPSKGMAKLCEGKISRPVINTLAENLDQIELGKFNAITVLWNVFGHIPNENRIKALKNLRDKLAPNGIILLDINNRHNSKSYGFLNVLYRRVVDTLIFKTSRGDAEYTWKIGNQTLNSTGHLFIPSEIEKMFGLANLKVIERLSVNYLTGEISTSPFQGQLFYILTVIT